MARRSATGLEGVDGKGEREGDRSWLTPQRFREPEAVLPESQVEGRALEGPTAEVSPRVLRWGIRGELELVEHRREALQRVRTTQLQVRTARSKPDLMLRTVGDLLATALFSGAVQVDEGRQAPVSGLGHEFQLVEAVAVDVER